MIKFITLEEFKKLYPDVKEGVSTPEEFHQELIKTNIFDEFEEMKDA